MSNRESYGSNAAYIKQRQLTFTEGEMQCALTLIETVCRQDFDGSIESLSRTIYLSEALFQDPLNFFDRYFAAMDSEHNRQLREAAIEFVSRPEFTGSIEQMRQFTESV